MPRSFVEAWLGAVSNDAALHATLPRLALLSVDEGGVDNFRHAASLCCSLPATLHASLFDTQISLGPGADYNAGTGE